MDNQQHKRGYKRVKTDSLDIVYIVRPGESNEELRYSLRSVAKNFPHKRIVIAGYKPSWIKNVLYLPAEQKGTKYQNAENNWRAVMKEPSIKDFVLFNDDFFIMRHVSKLPVYHRGELAEIINYYHSKYPGQAYVNNMVRTATMLDKLGVPKKEQRSYALHVPMVMNNQKRALLCKIAELLNPDGKDYQMRTLYGNFYRLGGAEMADVKINRPEVVPNVDETFVSTLDDSFRDGKVGVYIRRVFSDKCKYER